MEKNDVKVGGGRDVADLAVSSIKNKCKPLDHIDDDDDVKGKVQNKKKIIK